MANVTAVNFCPHCKKQLSSPMESCDGCHRRLKEYDSPYFATLDPIHIQMARIQKLFYGPKTLDQTFYEVGGQKVPKPELQELHNEMVNYFRRATIDQRVGMIRDCKLMMEQLVHAEEQDHDALKSIIFAAKKIGELGTAAESYLKAGGALRTVKNPYVKEQSWKPTTESGAPG